MSNRLISSSVSQFGRVSVTAVSLLNLGELREFVREADRVGLVDDIAIHVVDIRDSPTYVGKFNVRAIHASGNVGEQE